MHVNNSKRGVKDKMDFALFSFFYSAHEVDHLIVNCDKLKTHNILSRKLVLDILSWNLLEI